MKTGNKTEWRRLSRSLKTTHSRHLDISKHWVQKRTIQWIHKFNFKYEGGLNISLSAAISLQPLGEWHSEIPHMKAKDVPFQMGYGGLICSKALLCDEPKWGGRYADPRWTTVWKTVGKTMLDWGENRRCLSFSACHLAVSLSRICYHTSYERGPISKRATC